MPLVKREEVPPYCEIRGPHEIDPVKVYNYAQAIRDGDTFPPVRLVEYDTFYMIVDGHHRVMAYREAGKPIDAMVMQAEDFEDLDCEIRHTGQRADDEQFWNGQY